MTPIQWDGVINYKDSMFASLLGVDDRLERIVLILSDIFWRWCVGDEVRSEPLSRSDANDLMLFAICSRGITVERAMEVAPELNRRLSKRYGTNDLLEGILTAGVDGTHEAMTQEPQLHRFNRAISKSAYLMAEKLTAEYSGDARNLWSLPFTSHSTLRQRLTGKILLSRIMDFHGLGTKTGTMLFRILTISGPSGEAVVILEDGIEAGEISPDVHAVRVFKRLGLVGQEAKPNEVVKTARDLAVKYGHEAVEMDGAFYLGREVCTALDPDCQRSCPLSDNSVCDYPWQLKPEVVEALKRLQ